MKQEELGELLGISRSAITKTEAAQRLPTVQLLVAAELVFGIGSRELFPALFEQIERDVAAKAAVLHEQVAAEGSRPAASAFLNLLLARATRNPHPVCQQPTLFA